MSNKIVLTGGGTSGHVTPNLSLLPELLKGGWEVHYIGTKRGIESSIVPRDKVKYHSIRAGKWRRYFHWRNFTDPFNVLLGIIQATRIIKKVKPNIIFSKGGFVSVPVVVAGWLNRVPVVAHESDLTPGLANKISLPFLSQVCTSFAETLKYLPKDKSIHVGSPIREEIINGDYEKGLSICGFRKYKAILLVLGGSLGSVKLNNLIRENLNLLLDRFQIIHICGKGKLDSTLFNVNGYKQFEYLNEELAHIFSITDIAVARSGSNSIFEFLFLRIPSLLIPLPKAASRGDQIINALTFEKLGYSKTMQEQEITNEKFIQELFRIYENKDIFLKNMNAASTPDGKRNLLNIINKYYI